MGIFATAEDYLKVDGRDKSGKMTTCTFKNDADQQRNKCKLYTKATHERRCMFLVYGEYCWNNKATN